MWVAERLTNNSILNLIKRCIAMLDFDTCVLVSDRFVRELGSVYLWMLTMLYMTKYQPVLTAPTWTDREHIFAIKTTTKINYAINYAIVTTRKESPFEYSMSWSCTSSMSMRWFNCLLCFTLCFEQNCISASRLNCYETTREYISHYYIPPSICININMLTLLFLIWSNLNFCSMPVAWVVHLIVYEWHY